MTKFDRDRYCDLLNKRQIGELSYNEDKTEFLEFLELDRRVRDQRYYDIRNQFQELLQNYIAGKIENVRLFANAFSEIYEDRAVKLGKEINCCIDLWRGIQPISEWFSAHLEDIYEYCQSIVFRTKMKLKRGSPIDQEFASEEDSSRKYVKLILSRMAKYFEESLKNDGSSKF